MTKLLLKTFHHGDAHDNAVLFDAPCAVQLVGITGLSSTSKGRTETIGGVSSYVVGNATSPKAIVAIYDIFGFWSSTEQGADILAEATGARVVMPDLFEGRPLGMDVIPPDTPEKKKEMQDCAWPY